MHSIDPALLTRYPWLEHVEPALSSDYHRTRFRIAVGIPRRFSPSGHPYPALHTGPVTCDVTSRLTLRVLRDARPSLRWSIESSPFGATLVVCKRLDGALLRQVRPRTWLDPSLGIVILSQPLSHAHLERTDVDTLRIFDAFGPPVPR